MKVSWRGIQTGVTIVAVVLLILSIKQCRDNANNYASLKDYQASLNDTITYLKNGIAQKPAIEVTPNAFKDIVNENASLKKAIKEAEIKAHNVHTVTQVVTKTEIDTISISLHDSIPCADFVPITFGIDSLYYSIAGVIKKKSLLLTAVNFPDSVTIITANKNHFFKKDEFVVTVGHSNPLVKTIGLSNITVSEKRKWYESGWWKAGIGFAGGVIITRQITQ